MNQKPFSLLTRWIDPEDIFIIKLQNHVVCLILIGLTNLGFSSAIRSLVHRLDELSPNPTIDHLFRWVRWVITRSGRDQLWQDYFDTRNQALGRHLKQINRPASKQHAIPWLFSRLVLAKTENLTKPDETLVLKLWVYINDPDVHVKNQVVELLKTVNSLRAFQAICDKWIKTRNPLLENLILTSKIKPPIPPSSNILIYFLRKDLDLPSLKRAENIGALIDIFLQEEVRFQEMAGFLLRNLDTQISINYFCDAWAVTRDKRLESLLIQCQYSASAPRDVFLLTRLKLNKNLNQVKITPERVPLLIEFVSDSDPDIRHQAEHLLTHLSLPESQTAFLEFYIAEHPDVLTPLLSQLHFNTPRQDLLSMAFFMAEDWKKYEAIDYNQQFLSIYFYNAPDSIRKIILTKLQRSGNPQFTQILFLSNQYNRQTILTHAEVLSSIALFEQYENWPALWELCQNTYLDLSMSIFKTLRQQNWSPQDPSEQELFSELLKLSLPEKTPTIQEIINNIPFAIPISKLRFRGRINDVAFAPHEKILAMATNQRAVLLWNYQQGKAEHLIRGFHHSVGIVAYSEYDQLFIGEKTNGQDLCDLWDWSDYSLSLIGFHKGSVTSIHPIHKNLVVSAGKDNRLVAWNIPTKSIYKESPLSWWPRASFYYPEQNILRIFNKDAQDYSIPDLKLQPNQIYQTEPSIRSSVERVVSPTLNFQQLVVGQNNGQIILSQSFSNGKISQQKLIHELPSNLIGLTNTTFDNEFLAFGKNGEIERLNLSGEVTSLTHPITDQFTSFQISPDKTLFATGTNTAHTILWDLRPNQVKRFLQEPISEISNPQWAVLKFIKKQDNLEKNTGTVLSYCNILLEHRFKFDIELALIDELSPGEYDIELEQVYGE